MIHYNRETVSYTISRRPAFSMVIKMLDKVTVKLPKDTSAIPHSDQGGITASSALRISWQLTIFAKACSEKGIA